LSNPELTYKILDYLKREISRETMKGKLTFTSKKIGVEIGERGEIRKINAILNMLTKEGIIKFDEKIKRYYIGKEDVKRVEEYQIKLEKALLLEYHKPLSNIEPPIDVYKIVKGMKQRIAQAKRKSIIKPIYDVNCPEKYTIIFRTYKMPGFIINNGGEKVFEAYRLGFMKPIKAIYRGEEMLIRRRWGKEIIITKNGGEEIAKMKGYGIEKAIFTYEEALSEISIPIAIALFAIKQFDVII
jgi:hypothetical protein